MTKRVLVVGGYGNFGSFIVRRLSRESDLKIIVAGRSEEKAKLLANSVQAEWVAVDINNEIDAVFDSTKPDLVIHTSGPYQEQSYRVAETCVRHRANYIDLADGRDFVKDIVTLDNAAKAAGVLLISGASSVPALTSAIIDEYRSEFHSLDTLNYGIATAQKTNRGLATTQAVLSYAGQPFTTIVNGKMESVYGWQSLYWRKFPGLGWRALGNCDVPDLALFPHRYPELKTVQFRAGLGLLSLQLILWGLSWLVRARLLPNLRSAARPMLALSRIFDLFGTDASSFFMEIVGRDLKGRSKSLEFDLTARSGDGILIPCTPAIVAALKLARGELPQTGAMPCVGLLKLSDLLEELRVLDIQWGIRRFET